MNQQQLARIVDHTILKPETTQGQIIQTCEDARALHTATVCVNGCWVPLVCRELAGSEVKVCSVVGFPLGAVSEDVVVFETGNALDSGANEIDMVAPLGLIKTGDYKTLEWYVYQVRQFDDNFCLKVILETAVLTDQEIIDSCKTVVSAGADFVKTSTGFNPAGGATVHAVSLMRSTVGLTVGVKASGGIRTYDDALKMVDAGASRLGLSSTVDIVKQINV